MRSSLALARSITNIRTCVFTYITYIILLAAPSGLRLYDAEEGKGREVKTEAHSKNHTTDKRNGGIISRSRGSSDERAGSDVCRRSR